MFHLNKMSDGCQQITNFCACTFFRASGWWRCQQFKQIFHLNKMNDSCQQMINFCMCSFFRWSGWWRRWRGWGRGWWDKWECRTSWENQKNFMTCRLKRMQVTVCVWRVLVNAPLPVCSCMCFGAQVRLPMSIWFGGTQDDLSPTRTTSLPIDGTANEQISSSFSCCGWLEQPAI